MLIPIDPPNMPRPARPRRKSLKAAARRTGRHASSRSTDSVTLTDVAKLAGVSPMTVSRVLNRPELVTTETIEHVQQVIDHTGYVPNMLAGALASRRSRLVAAVVPSITNAIFVEAVQALTDRLWQAGYQVLLGLSGYPATREDALLAAVLSRRPDALYLTGINHSAETRHRLLAARIPIVETWDMTPTPIDMLVGFSHEKIGEEVARHLHAKGHRRLGLLTADDERALARHRSFLGEAKRLGVDTVETVSIPAPSTLALGRDGMARMLNRRVRPDAVFCGSDLLAQGALEEARSRGLDVPRDLALMGFGGLEFTRHTFPALSSVEIDRAAIGREAAEALLARIDGKARPRKIVDVGFRIVDRATT
jgi:LacI family transcriptional regulator, gluconate utilization system Gnt-I transcriptional repressor